MNEFFIALKSIVQNIIGHSIFVHFVAIITSAVLMFKPVQGFIILALFLTLADMITGIKAATHTGIKIQSRKLSRTFTKFTLYAIGIGVAHLFEHFMIVKLIGDSQPLSWLACLYIAIGEMQSIYENINRVTGIDIWKAIKDKIKKLV
jgi:phage-related holin